MAISCIVIIDSARKKVFNQFKISEIDLKHLIYYNDSNKLFAKDYFSTDHKKILRGKWESFEILHKTLDILER